MLKQLLDQIPDDEPIEAVIADGAYDTQQCHRAIAQRQAQAIIPPRKNGQLWKEGPLGATVRNEALLACERLGQRVMARTFDRQSLNFR